MPSHMRTACMDTWTPVISIGKTSVRIDPNRCTSSTIYRHGMKVFVIGAHADTKEFAKDPDFMLETEFIHAR